MGIILDEGRLRDKVYSGYYYRGIVFEGQSALPFILEDDPSLWPFNWRFEPPWDKQCPIPGKKEGVVKFQVKDLGFAYDENGERKHFYIAKPYFEFRSIR